MPDADVWINARMNSPDDKRKLRLAAANAGMTLSHYVRLAIEEKLQRAARAVRDNRHPIVPVGTPGTTPVICGSCNEQEVRTQWEMDNHGKCRQMASECHLCLMAGQRTPPSPSVRTS